MDLHSPRGRTPRATPGCRTFDLILPDHGLRVVAEAPLSFVCTARVPPAVGSLEKRLNDKQY